MIKNILPLVAVLLFGCNHQPATPPAANLHFTTKTIIKSTGPCKDSVSVCAKVTFEFPVFEGEDADSLNALVALKMGAGYLDTLHHSNYKEVAEQFLNSYDTILKQMTDYTLPWEWTKKVEVFSQSNGLITLHVYNYDFAGGNHGNEYNEYLHYDLLQHRSLHYTDVIETGKSTAFTAIAENIFRENFHLKKDEPLDSVGFFFAEGKFTLPENYWFTDTGIVFHYNDYELRSHAEGPYDLMIPYDAFDSLRKKAAPEKNS